MSKKLFVGGLSWGTTDDTLRSVFEEFGPVVEARVITDRETGRSRGFGFVGYDSEDDAAKAQEAMDGAEVDGRRIRVNPAEDKPPRPGGGGGRRPGGSGRPPGGDRSGPPGGGRGAPSSFRDDEGGRRDRGGRGGGRRDRGADRGDDRRGGGGREDRWGGGGGDDWGGGGGGGDDWDGGGRGRRRGR